MWPVFEGENNWQVADTSFDGNQEEFEETSALVLDAFEEIMAHSTRMGAFGATAMADRGERCTLFKVVGEPHGHDPNSMVEVGVGDDMCEGDIVVEVLEYSKHTISWYVPKWNVFLPVRKIVAMNLDIDESKQCPKKFFTP